MSARVTSSPPEGKGADGSGEPQQTFYCGRDSRTALTTRPGPTLDPAIRYRICCADGQAPLSPSPRRAGPSHSESWLRLKLVSDSAEQQADSMALGAAPLESIPSLAGCSQASVNAAHFKSNGLKEKTIKGYDRTLMHRLLYTARRAR